MTPAASTLSDDRKSRVRLLIVLRELFWAATMLGCSISSIYQGNKFWCIFLAFWAGTHMENLVNHFEWLERKWEKRGWFGRIIG